MDLGFGFTFRHQVENLKPIQGPFFFQFTIVFFFELQSHFFQTKLVSVQVHCVPPS